ncbi:MAG: hypothetical protein C4329_13800 [Chitinophagaceae bacterium]
MKKLLVLVALFLTMYASNAQGQGGGDPAARMQRIKEMIKPQLIEKTKLTDAQADKVLEAYASTMQKMREVRMDQAFSEDDKKKKTEEINAERLKAYGAIPLTADQIKAVNDFFEEIRKNRPQRPAGGQ